MGGEGAGRRGKVGRGLGWEGKVRNCDGGGDKINTHKTVRATHEQLLEVLGLQEQLAT